MSNVKRITDRTVKTNLIHAMQHFNEPISYQPDRYDNWIEHTSALREAIKEYRLKHGGSNEEVQKTNNDWLSELPLRDVFRVIELQYNILSPTEASAFMEIIDSHLAKQGKWRMISNVIVDANSIPEKRLSDVTRQRIIELIIGGFQDPSTGQHATISWSGRIDEIEFLKRLYSLSTMESTDIRFNNAEGDIIQHRNYSSDWNDDWIFYYRPINLKNGIDEKFLRFLCEMFDPYVRDENRNWMYILSLINELLRIDGYELFVNSHRSEKTVYGWRSISDQNLVIQKQAISLIDSFNSEHITKQIKVMQETIDHNPYEAIGKSKELLETCCKTILVSENIEIDDNWTVGQLTKKTFKVLKLTPDDIDDAVRASQIIKQLLGQLSGITGSMAELRNSYGSGHGKDAKFKGLKPRHAKLAVGASVTATHFLWDTYAEKFNKK